MKGGEEGILGSGEWGGGWWGGGWGYMLWKILGTFTLNDPPRCTSPFTCINELEIEPFEKNPSINVRDPVSSIVRLPNEGR